MRLTLRTMLAYLDDVLSESDAEELGNKIERSDFASGLVHKIRNSIGRLRLSSPELFGQDLMDDPNTVAEFIDSALPPDKEQDFEKVCLKSDKHLAEVASCHQILALVLGTPARVEPKLRERIYRTSGDGAPAEPDSEGNGASGEPFRRVDPTDVATAEIANEADADVTPRSRTASGSHPELGPIGAGRGLLPIGIAVLVGFVLTAGVLIAMGPLNDTHIIARIFGSRPPKELALQDGSTSGTVVPPTRVPPTTDEPISPRLVNTPDGGDEIGTPEAPVELESPPDNPTVDAPVIDGQFSLQPQAPEVDDAFHITAENGALSTDLFVPPALIRQAPNLVEPDDASPQGVDAPTVSALDEVSPSDDSVSSDAQTGTTESGSTEADGIAQEPVGVGADPALPADPALSVDPALPVDVGHFLSENELLVFWDDQSGWMRLPSRTALVVGQQLRSLPMYRPQLLLAQSSVQVSLRGRSELTFEAPMASGIPVIAIPYGQLSMNAIGQGKSCVAVRSGDRLFVIEFVEPDTEIAVHTQRVLLPGSDPQSEPPHNLIQIWVTQGVARIDEDGATQDVAAGNQFALADGHPPQLTVFTELPEWVYSRVDEVDRDAAAELETLLPVRRDLTLSLNENAAHRRTDVRLLSCRCLMALNDFEAGAALFSEPGKRYQLAWPALFDELQAAVARDPQTANGVLEIFEKLYGGDAGKLYRMLLGYTDEQLAAGRAAELVENLDNDRVEFRVLSIENLKRLTGKTYLYMPAQSEKSRQSKVARWRTELRKGNITVRQQPTGLADLERLSMPDS